MSSSRRKRRRVLRRTGTSGATKARGYKYVLFLECGHFIMRKTDRGGTHALCAECAKIHV